MANILPVSDLKNYNEVLKNCHKGEPVYLTKNGRGRFVVMDIEVAEVRCKTFQQTRLCKSMNRSESNIS